MYIFIAVPQKDFMNALKTFIKPFWGTIKNCENENLRYLLPLVRDWGSKG